MCREMTDDVDLDRECGKRKRDDDETLIFEAAYVSQDLLMHMIYSAMDVSIPVVTTVLVNNADPPPTSSVAVPIDDECDKVYDELYEESNASKS